MEGGGETGSGAAGSGAAVSVAGDGAIGGSSRGGRAGSAVVGSAGSAGAALSIGLTARGPAATRGPDAARRLDVGSTAGCEIAGAATRCAATRAVSEAGSIPVVVAVASVATAPNAAPTEGVIGSRARRGACESQESGPITSRIRPREMFTKARTRRGSNCVPAQRVSSSRASVAVAGSLYERAEVITSKTSAIATMRPARGIRSPSMPRG